LYSAIKSEDTEALKDTEAETGVEHELKLYTRRRRLELRRNFFSQRVVVHWNKLPESVVKAETVNTFKNRLDRCNEWGI